MKFTVDQHALTDGVNWVSRSLSTRPIKTELLGIKIDATGDQVILSASDLETSSKSHFSADIFEKGEVLVGLEISGHLIFPIKVQNDKGEEKVLLSGVGLLTGLVALAAIKALELDEEDRQIEITRRIITFEDDGTSYTESYREETYVFTVVGLINFDNHDTNRTYYENDFVNSNRNHF